MRRVPVRPLTILLLLLNFVVATVYAADGPFTPATAKQQLEAHGVGKMVKLKQANGISTRAKIVAIGDTAVTLQDGSKPKFEVAYGTLTEVQGGGLPRIAKITIVVVVVFIALGIVGTRV